MNKLSVDQKERPTFRSLPQDGTNLLVDNVSSQVENKKLNRWHTAAIVCGVIALLAVGGIFAAFIPAFGSGLVFADFIAVLSTKALFELTGSAVLLLAYTSYGASFFGLIGAVVCFCIGKRTQNREKKSHQLLKREENVNNQNGRKAYENISDDGIENIKNNLLSDFLCCSVEDEKDKKTDNIDNENNNFNIDKDAPDLKTNKKQSSFDDNDALPDNDKFGKSIEINEEATIHVYGDGNDPDGLLFGDGNGDVGSDFLDDDIISGPASVKNNTKDLLNEDNGEQLINGDEKLSQNDIVYRGDDPYVRTNFCFNEFDGDNDGLNLGLYEDGIEYKKKDSYKKTESLKSYKNSYEISDDNEKDGSLNGNFINNNAPFQKQSRFLIGNQQEQIYNDIKMENELKNQNDKKRAIEKEKMLYTNNDFIVSFNKDKEEKLTQLLMQDLSTMLLQQAVTVEKLKLMIANLKKPVSDFNENKLKKEILNDILFDHYSDDTYGENFEMPILYSFYWYLTDQYDEATNNNQQHYLTTSLKGSTNWCFYTVDDGFDKDCYIRHCFTMLVAKILQPVLEKNVSMLNDFRDIKSFGKGKPNIAKTIIEKYPFMKKTFKFLFFKDRDKERLNQWLLLNNIEDEKSINSDLKNVKFFSKKTCNEISLGKVKVKKNNEGIQKIFRNKAQQSTKGATSSVIINGMMMIQRQRIMLGAEKLKSKNLHDVNQYKVSSRVSAKTGARYLFFKWISDELEWKDYPLTKLMNETINKDVAYLKLFFQKYKNYSTFSHKKEFEMLLNEIKNKQDAIFFDGKFIISNLLKNGRLNDDSDILNEIYCYYTNFSDSDDISNTKKPLFLVSKDGFIKELKSQQELVDEVKDVESTKKQQQNETMKKLLKGLFDNGKDHDEVKFDNCNMRLGKAQNVLTVAITNKTHSNFAVSINNQGDIIGVEKSDYNDAFYQYTVLSSWQLKLLRDLVPEYFMARFAFTSGHEKLLIRGSRSSDIAFCAPLMMQRLALKIEKNTAEISVSYTQGSNAMGTDAGGLRRDFIDTLFKYVAQSDTFRHLIGELKGDEKLPTQQSNEEKKQALSLMQAMGTLFVFLLKTEQRLSAGRYIPKWLLETIFAVLPELFEVNHKDCSVDHEDEEKIQKGVEEDHLNTRLKVYDVFIKNSEDNQTQRKLIDCLKKTGIKNAKKLTDQEIKAIISQAIPEEKQYTYIHEYVVDVDKIKSEWLTVVKIVLTQSRVFQQAIYSFSGIVAIATGMANFLSRKKPIDLQSWMEHLDEATTKKAIEHMSYMYKTHSNKAWGWFTNATILSDIDKKKNIKKILGEFDRKVIVAKIVATNWDEKLTVAVGQIKKAILDLDQRHWLTDELLARWLVGITGSSTVTDKDIKINILDDAGKLCNIHTCFNRVDLNVKLCKNYPDWVNLFFLSAGGGFNAS